MDQSLPIICSNNCHGDSLIFLLVCLKKKRYNPDRLVKIFFIDYLNKSEINVETLEFMFVHCSD